MKRFFSFKNIALGFLLAGTIVFAQVFSAYAQSGIQQMNPQLNGGNINQHFVLPCNALSHNVHGQLFSSTIGWIYLNCADYTGAAIGNFGVVQDTAGRWNGYGWSPSIGWVKFGNGGNSSSNVGCPQHAGWNVNPANTASGCDVQHIGLSGTPIASYQIVGWARACTAAANPTTCTGDTNNLAGGWDGWISMSGLNDQNPTAAGLQTTTSYKAQLAQYVNPNGHQPISGFVWGGDVVGWAKFFNAYVDTTIQQTNTAHLTLTANPTSVTGSGTTALTYTIPAAEKAYFTGQPCTATSSPAVGSPWDGSRTNFSASSTSFSITIPSVSVPSNPTVYTISCPVSIQGSNQTVATASVTVSKDAPTVTLTIPNHDLCVAGSMNGLQSTTASWVASTGSYCKLFRDNTAVGGQLPLIGSSTVGAFSSPTSTNYVTPVSNGDQHEYVVRCYDAGNTLVAESNKEYVGVAPATWNGPTANGTLNCTQPDWGITMASGGSQVICQGNTPVSLTWASWGVVPQQYTYAKLKRATSQNGTYGTVIGSYGLGDTEPSISSAGWYKVFYYDVNGNEAPITSAAMYISSVSGTTCPQFSGLSSAGPYCPAGSVNTAAILPKTYSWSSDAASCTLNGASAGANGSFTLSSVPASRTLSCTWADGTSATSSASYGPMLTATSTFCATPPGGRPVIIEN